MNEHIVAPGLPSPGSFLQPSYSTSDREARISVPSLTLTGRGAQALSLLAPASSPAAGEEWEGHTTADMDVATMLRCINEAHRVASSEDDSPTQCRPSGPRKSGEGCEDEAQAILQATITPTQGGRLLITILASGFVIGPEGASIQDICATTGADIRSFTTTGPHDRCCREFVVEGESAAVAHALHIIYSAVRRYKKLCEGGYRGRYVRRDQHVEGVTFFYHPPPRDAVPHAAKLLKNPRNEAAARGGVVEVPARGRNTARTARTGQPQAPRAGGSNNVSYAAALAPSLGIPLTAFPSQTADTAAAGSYRNGEQHLPRRPAPNTAGTQQFGYAPPPVHQYHDAPHEGQLFPVDVYTGGYYWEGAPQLAVADGHGVMDGYLAGLMAAQQGGYSWQEGRGSYDVMNGMGAPARHSASSAYEAGFCGKVPQMGFVHAATPRTSRRSATLSRFANSVPQQAQHAQHHHQSYGLVPSPPPAPFTAQFTAEYSPPGADAEMYANVEASPFAVANAVLLSPVGPGLQTGATAYPYHHHGYHEEQYVQSSEFANYSHHESLAGFDARSAIASPAGYSLFGARSGSLSRAGSDSLMSFGSNTSTPTHAAAGRAVSGTRVAAVMHDMLKGAASWDTPLALGRVDSTPSCCDSEPEMAVQESTAVVGGGFHIGAKAALGGTLWGSGPALFDSSRYQGELDGEEAVAACAAHLLSGWDAAQ